MGETLGDYYNLNFQLMQHHKYSLTELDNMIPWEREVYIGLLKTHIEEENKKLREQQQQGHR